MSYVWSDHGEVEKNRRNFLDRHGLALKDCVMMRLEHGANIAIVEEGHKGQGTLSENDGLPVDALITNKKGICLAMVTADCFPLLFVDHEKCVVGLAHLGWKSADLGLARKVVERMQETFASDLGTIEIITGPGIHKESYRIEDPVQKNDPKWHSFLRELKTGETEINLLGFIKHDLCAAGITPEQIEDVGTDAATSTDYFSHYRSVRTGESEGRFMTVIRLEL